MPTSKLFKKAILEPGIYRSPDGEVTVTPERLKHWSRTFKKMASRNQVIPVHWDHSDDPTQSVPVSHAEWESLKTDRSAKNTVGRMKDIRLASDGNQAEITLELHNPDAIQQAETNSVYVSPVIFSEWFDGRGRKYEDCFTHMDLVDHPVDDSQTPFEPVAENALACALRMGLDMGKPKIYRFAKDEDMDSAADNLDDDSGGDDDTGGESAGGSEDKGSDVKSLAENVMSQVNAEVPVDFDPMTEEGLTLMLTAVLNAIQNRDSGGGEEETEELPDEEEAVAAVPPEFAALSQRFDNRLKKVNQQIEAQEKLHVARHRLALIGRLDELVKSGRCTSKEYKDQATSLKGVRLSLDDSGQFNKSDIEKWIESRETLPQGAAWNGDQRLRLAQVEAVPQPDTAEGTMNDVSDERADEIIKDLFHGRKTDMNRG